MRSKLFSDVLSRLFPVSAYGTDFSLSEATRGAVIAMYRERLDNGGDKIGSFGLEIDSDGKFRFQISYDKPDRINGNFRTEKQQKIHNYLATYQPKPTANNP
jgi:hypothetical protein